MSHPEPSADPSSEPAAILRREADLFVPTHYAQGPWNPEHMHGGPICGVLGRAIEACESPVPMRVARMTVEMTRAVPMEPFSVHAEVTRSGRRIQQIDARIEAAGKMLVRATALRVRVGEADEAVSIPLDERVLETTGAGLQFGDFHVEVLVASGMERVRYRFADERHG